MTPTYDTAIVGAGLAGACTALHLAEKERILLAEAGSRPGGASVVAAGLANPYMARKARPVWRYRDALAALDETADLAGAFDLLDRRGILRPAADARQAGFFRETAEAHADCHWKHPQECAERYPGLHAPLGALLVKSGVAVDITSFLDALLSSIEERGGAVRLSSRVEAIEASAPGVKIRFAGGRDSEATARRVIICVGDRYADFGLDSLNLHRIKGQTVEVEKPQEMTQLPHLAGKGYVLHSESRLVLGSSYEHDFSDSKPDPRVSRSILEKVKEMVPSVSGCKILKESAGIRVTVPGTRRPMVGPLPGRANVWVLTGLSSKGLLMAPLIASEMWRYLREPERIPRELRVH